jgi:hypothetical protein
MILSRSAGLNNVRRPNFTKGTLRLLTQQFKVCREMPRRWAASVTLNKFSIDSPCLVLIKKGPCQKAIEPYFCESKKSVDIFLDCLDNENA